ncbi:poly(A)-specific ribonuclease PNLDC1-like [Dendronephthya gigantea]|uniref:poly(A)-specific ribonuclease PNLDC1-like n=1 Tax=Dendronephthya gigantea TaxID=151771 RepID=UPI001069E84E|nr:poly(A)-specific ribonuclease PNLDC1-like [Dendronephthya gigantea]
MDVVRSNFEVILPQIEAALEKSEFIAIDTEFTGLAANDNQQPSLFDAPCERYTKLKRMVNQFLVCQFGVSAFVKSQEYSNTYEAHTYNFHLYPSSFGQQHDIRFTCQASSLEFLCNHRFDFNKFVYEGISYLNGNQRAELQELCLKNHVKIASSLNKVIEQDFLCPNCDKIEEWLKENKTNTLILDCHGVFFQFLLYQDIRKKFANLDCEVQPHGKLLVKRESLEKEQQADYDEQIMRIVQSFCGFTRVFELFVKLKKPLVGHNLFTDILFMYEKFNSFLPDDYKIFKRNIHELFPFIIDTKHLAFALNRHEILCESELFKKTNLEELYSELSSHKGLYYVLYTPTIVHSKLCQKYVNSHNIHEAGYDAYISGYVFLRMAHILTAKTSGSTFDGAAEFRQYFDAVKSYGNIVNISRATVPFLNLAGEDPKSIRPRWLHISRRRSLKRLTAGQILKELDRFGSLDVKVLDDQRALVATGHSKVSQRILKALRRHKQLKARNYYPLLDSPNIRTFLWAGGVATAAVTFFGVVAAVCYGKEKLNETS